MHFESMMLFLHLEIEYAKCSLIVASVAAVALFILRKIVCLTLLYFYLGTCSKLGHSRPARIEDFFFFLTSLANVLSGAKNLLPWLFMVGDALPPIAYISQCV